MTISALVLTIDSARAGAVLARLAGDARLTVGQPVASRSPSQAASQAASQVPVVAETGSCRDGRRLVEELQALPGIELVHVVMVDFSMDFSEDASAAPSVDIAGKEA